MPRPETLLRIATVLATVLGLAPSAATPHDPAQSAIFRHRAEIQIVQPAALVRLPLPLSAHARSEQAEFGDLRIVDADGRRVPFALLPTAAARNGVETLKWAETTMFALPSTAGTAAPSPGWIFDLGQPTGPGPQTLQLRWTGPAEFSAGFILQTSPDLKTWRSAGSGQVMALAPAGSATLAQPDIALPSQVERYLRLEWIGSGPFPTLNGARAATPSILAQATDPPTVIELDPTNATEHELRFDIGAALALRRVDLLLPAAGILPVQVQGREREGDPWRTIASTVFYRFERAGDVSRPPPLDLGGQRLRQIRLLADARVSVPATARLRVETELASLVFARQGREPLVLLVGSAQATPGALPLSTVVPDLVSERPRLGLARVATFAEVPEAAAQAHRDAQTASLRPWLLWTVLILGVLALATMVWRLARGRS